MLSNYCCPVFGFRILWFSLVLVKKSDIFHISVIKLLHTEPLFDEFTWGRIVDAETGCKQHGHYGQGVCTETPQWTYHWLRWDVRRDLAPRLRSQSLALAAAVLSAVSFPAVAASPACLIEPSEFVDLGSPAVGLIKRVHVAKADTIRRGQLLVSLDVSAESAAAKRAHFRATQAAPRQMAEKKIQFAREELQRKEALSADNLIPRQERDDVEAKLRLAEAELEAAIEAQKDARLEHRYQRALIGQRSLKSPFDGVVVEKKMHAGEVAEPGGGKGGILRLAKLNPLKIRLVLKKETYGQIRKGMKVKVRPEIPANAEYTATVKAVDRIIDAASGTYVVYLELENRKLDKTSGVRCSVSLDGLLGRKATGGS